MSKPTISFWIISVIALVWNLMGVSQYIQQARIIQIRLELCTQQSN